MHRIIMDTTSLSQKEDKIFERHSLSYDGILHQVNFTPVSVSLRNDNLSELPTGIGKLCAFRYLNLSFTKIRKLPVELTNLKNLMFLVLDHMFSLEIIPQELISSLISLKLFSMYNNNVLSGVEERLLDELESLNGINEIGMTIFTTLSFNKLNGSHKL